MPIQNADVVEIFSRAADLLDIEDANPFRVRAYRNAARIVSGLQQELAEMIRSGRSLTELPGIGKDLAAKIAEILETGTLSQLQELEKQTAPGLIDLMKLPGLGPRRVQALYKQLGIRNLQQLQAAAESGKIRGLEGFGLKTERQILEACKAGAGAQDRIKLIEAEQRLEPLLAYLRELAGIRKIDVAGSFRRRKETVADLDILVSCRSPSTLMDRFVAFEDVEKVISKGTTRSSIVLRSQLQVDLRVVPAAGYGAALHYFTGSKPHNIAVRKLGLKRNLKINEYGVFKGERRVAGKTETEVFAAVGLAYVEPELREDRGEIEAAAAGKLPRLITGAAIRGDLHAHTHASDGHATLEQMAEAARERGYQYLAITEHSQNVRIARGLDGKRLAAQLDQIDRLNRKWTDFRLLKGIEVDILADGSLDLPDEILAALDLRVCSVHYHQKLSREKQTARILRAMENPHFNILAHPTGRLINARKAYEVDLARVMQAARERGCFMELNAHPDRLDLTAESCRMAKEMGVKVAISTDAHRVADLGFMRCGIYQARRGWLEAGDVLNTLSWEALQALLRRD